VIYSFRRRGIGEPWSSPTRFARREGRVDGEVGTIGDDLAKSKPKPKPKPLWDLLPASATYTFAIRIIDGSPAWVPAAQLKASPIF
jgi:hypothetical protein